MSANVLDQQLVFVPDATTQHSYAYLPNSLRGQYSEYIIYVEFGASTSAGKIQIQTIWDQSIPGIAWANVGSTIDWAAEKTTKYAAITGVFGSIRLDIDTAIANGVVRAWVIASPI